jgi:hypothetical protein
MKNSKMRVVVLSPVFHVSVVSVWTITMMMIVGTGVIVVPLVQGFVSTTAR